MFRTRLISGIVLVVLALVTILTGGWLLFGVSLILSLIGLFELYRAVGVREDKGGCGPLELVGFLGAVLYYVSLVWAWGRFQMAAVLLSLILLLAVYVLTYPRYRAEQVMASVFGLLYVAVMLSYIYQTRQLDRGSYLVWLIFLSSWGCDTCAYCVGMLIGRHKMAPVLSPKKSVEGAVGGLLGALLLGVIYGLATGQPAMEFAIICAFGALVSMIGDLAASAIKRNFSIKDYGRLIPGHGGILDRFDSVIFTAPIIYYLAATIL